jgi:hypothetical protein
MSLIFTASSAAQAVNTSVSPIRRTTAFFSKTSEDTPLATSKLAWPSALPDQVTALRNLIPETGADASALAGYFGKRTQKRLTEIEQILTTLRNLGQL